MSDRDAEIEALEAEAKGYARSLRAALRDYADADRERREARAIIARVEALLVCDCGCEGPAAAVTGVTLRAALAAQPTDG